MDRIEPSNESSSTSSSSSSSSTDIDNDTMMKSAATSKVNNTTTTTTTNTTTASANHAMEVDSEDDDDDLLQSNSNHEHEHNPNRDDHNHNHSHHQTQATNDIDRHTEHTEHTHANGNTTTTTTTTTTTPPQSSASRSQSDEFDVEITEEDYESIAIMIDELMKDDPAIRIKAIRSLPIISKALGAERTRSELIPYITQMIDDDDEVLLVLIEEIYRLLTLKLIGGHCTVNNRYAFCLIPPFERLCQVEEKIVRDEATLKFGQIIHDMPYRQYPSYFEQYVLPLFKRLCDCEYHTSRISGATLIANAFSKFTQLLNDAQPQAPAQAAETETDTETGAVEDTASLCTRLQRYKSEMRDLLCELCTDNIPIVRRSAIITVGKIVSVLHDKQEVLQHYLPLFKKLANDDQDNVRVFAVDTLIQFSHILSPQEVKEHLIYHIRLLTCDQAWRVRYIASDNFINLCAMLDTRTVRDAMVSYFIKLLKDNEPEVRAVAISKIPGVAKLIGVKLSIETLIPIICDKLIDDKNKYARASLASIIIPFCYLLPHQIVIDKILSCILRILKDEYPNVRLHVISNICAESECVIEDKDKDADEHDDEDDDEEMIEVEVETEVIDEVEVMVEVDEHGNEIELDATQLSMPCMDGREHKLVTRKRKRMEKRVEKRRMRGMKKFDISQLEEAIIPSIMELTLDHDWRVRLGIIEKFPALAKQFGLQFFTERLFSLCLASLEDNVADIRLAAASNLYQIATVFNASQRDQFAWTKEHLIPALIDKITTSKHYLHRIVYLLSFQYLCEALGVADNHTLLQQILHFMTEDSVANVRFKACQIMTFLAKHSLIEHSFVSNIQSKLEHIVQTDDDVDVIYYAGQCMEALSHD